MYTTSMMRGVATVLLGLSATCLADFVAVDPLGKSGLVSDARLGQIVLDVCDHDKNHGLTLYEVNITLMAIANTMPAASPELDDMVRQARSITPAIFRIVDEDDDKEVTGKELLWVSEMYDTLKEKPVLKGLSNAIFTVLDADGDDGLSTDEISAAIQTEGVVDKLIAIFDERFPVRPPRPCRTSSRRAERDSVDARAQIPVLKHGITPDVLLANLQPAFDAMDVNDDGRIERKESLKAALSFKKQVSATLPEPDVAQA